MSPHSYDVEDRQGPSPSKGLVMRMSLRVLVLAVVASALIAVRAQAQEKKPKTQEEMFARIAQALPEKAPAQPKAKRKVLVFSKTSGFRHSSIPVGTKTIAMMGDKTGAFVAVLTEDESYFEPEKLKVFDAVLMLNTTGYKDNSIEPLCPAFKKDDAEGERRAREREEVLKRSLVEFVSGGKGLMGIHAATDTYKAWKEFNTIMGGAFESHPWGAGSKVTVKV